MSKETTEKSGVVEDKRETTGSATFDWEDSVLCNCWDCDSCHNENRVCRSVRPAFCMHCGVKFEKYND